MFNEAVKNGAAWLDEKDPGWMEKIDLTRLDMEDCSQCILGQILGNFNRAEEIDDDVWVVEHGFDTLFSNNDEEDDEQYPQLAIAWKNFIEERISGEPRL